MGDDFSISDALNANAGVVGLGVGAAALRNQARTQAEIEGLKKLISKKFEEDAKKEKELLKAKENLFQFSCRLQDCSAHENIALKYLFFLKLKNRWLLSGLNSNSFDDLNEKKLCETLDQQIKQFDNEFKKSENMEIIEAAQNLGEYIYFIRDIKKLLNQKKETIKLEEDFYSFKAPTAANLEYNNSLQVGIFLLVLCVSGLIICFFGFLNNKDEFKTIGGLFFFLSIIFTVHHFIQRSNAIVENNKYWESIKNEKEVLFNQANYRLKEMEGLLQKYSLIDNNIIQAFLDKNTNVDGKSQYLQLLEDYLEKLAESLQVPKSFLKTYSD
jgi:hypothetical protein